MFDISWSELLLIAVVALVFIGPKELPGVLRTIGQYTGKIRRMASEFQDQFREAIREAEMADVKKDIDEATSHLNTDPFAGVNDTWKPSEPTTSPAPAADAPPAPPAEAVAPVTPEAHPAEPAPAAAQPAPTTAEPAAAEPTTSAPKPPASGDQAA